MILSPVFKIFSFIEGPDHLAAILPASIGRSFPVAMRLGAAWGVGHSIPGTIIGIIAFLLKDRIQTKLKLLQRMSAWTETAVGLSLVLIGVLGIKENLENEKEQSDNSVTNDQSIKALFANGFLHGFSWDGAAGLAPALAMNSWPSFLAYIASYALGTTSLMSITSGAIGESTKRISEVSKSKAVLRNLSKGSSLLAIAVGVVWIWNVFH
jgi:cytochrome c biogenesis protein CcdA